MPALQQENQGDPTDPKMPSKTEPEVEKAGDGASPWVRYRVEYRDALSGELLCEVDARNQEESLDNHPDLDEPIFELVTIYQSRRSVVSAENEDSTSILTLSSTKYLKLYSPAIINALQSVVKYYPSQDLSGNPIIVNYPYAVLAHHYDELDAFRQDCSTKAPSEMCAREQHASEHLAQLLKFLDNNIMEDVRREIERNKKGTKTWELLWVGYKPGSTRVERFDGEGDHNASVVHSVSGGIFESPPIEWHVQTWALDYNGVQVGMRSKSFMERKFDGEKIDEEEHIYPSTGEFLKALEAGTLTEEATKKIEYGKMWWNLLKMQCKHYKGRSQEYPHNEVSSRNLERRAPRRGT